MGSLSSMRRVKAANTGKVHLGYVSPLDKQEVSLQCCGYIRVDGEATEDPINCKVCRHVLDLGQRSKPEVDQVADNIMADRLTQGYY